MTSVTTQLRDTVARALAEDLGSADLELSADVTSSLAFQSASTGSARLFAKVDGVLAGIDCAVAAFQLLDPGCRIDHQLADGARFGRGDDVLRVTGDAVALLAAERTALNFLQRLSGIATRTRRFVELVDGTGARILDTRKTTPGLRQLEKAAVLAGGGVNHRIGLFDQVLLKENHFGFARPVSYEEVVRRCCAGHDRPVVAEARSLEEAEAAVRGGAGVVLLDNFEPGPALREAVARVRELARQLGREIETEASGGIDESSVRSFAECGVDRISIGGLTHSVVAVDLSMIVEGVA